MENEFIIAGYDIRNEDNIPASLVSYIGRESEKGKTIEDIRSSLEGSDWDKLSSIDSKSEIISLLEDKNINAHISNSLSESPEFLISNINIKNPEDIPEGLMNIIKSEISNGKTLLDIQDSLGEKSNFNDISEVIEDNDDLRLNLEQKSTASLIREFILNNDNTKVSGYDLNGDIPPEVLKHIEEKLSDGKTSVSDIQNEYQKEGRSIDDDIDKKDLKAPSSEDKKASHPATMSGLVAGAVMGGAAAAAGIFTGAHLNKWRGHKLNQANDEMRSSGEAIEKNISTLQTEFSAELKAYNTAVSLDPASADSFKEKMNETIQNSPKADLYNSLVEGIQVNQAAHMDSMGDVVKRANSLGMMNEDTATSFKDKVVNNLDKWKEGTDIFESKNGQSLSQDFDEMMEKMIESLNEMIQAFMSKLGGGNE